MSIKNLIARNPSNMPNPQQWERILAGEAMNIGDTHYAAERLGAVADIDNWSEGYLTGRVARYPANSNLYQMLDYRGAETFEGYQSRGFFGDAFSSLASIAQTVAPVAQFIPVIGPAFAIVSAIESGDPLRIVGALAPVPGFSEVATAAKFVSAVESGNPLAIVSSGISASQEFNLFPSSPAPVYDYAEPPAPAPVYVEPAPIWIEPAPAPVYVEPAPIWIEPAPAPVYVEPAPIWIEPPPPPPPPQEAAIQEAARQEALRQEAALQEAARQEALRQEAALQEAARQEALWQEALRQEAALQEAARQEALWQEAALQEAARQEAARQEALWQEALRQEAALQEAARQEAARQEAERISAEQAPPPAPVYVEPAPIWIEPELPPVYLDNTGALDFNPLEPAAWSPPPPPPEPPPPPPEPPRWQKRSRGSWGAVSNEPAILPPVVEVEAWSPPPLDTGDFAEWDVPAVIPAVEPPPGSSIGISKGDSMSYPIGDFAEWDVLPPAGYFAEWDVLPPAGDFAEWDVLPPAGDFAEWDVLPPAGDFAEWDVPAVIPAVEPPPVSWGGEEVFYTDTPPYEYGGEVVQRTDATDPVSPPPAPTAPTQSMAQIIKEISGAAMAAIGVVKAWETRKLAPNPVARATRPDGAVVTARSNGTIVTTDTRGKVTVNRPEVGLPQSTEDGFIIINNGDGSFTRISPLGQRETIRYPGGTMTGNGSGAPATGGMSAGLLLALGVGAVALVALKK
jgi:hypothetical protein